MIFRRLCVSIVLVMFVRSMCSGQQAELIVQNGHASPGTVYSVAFSSNGQTLASGGSDGTIALWDVATGRGLRTLKDQELIGGEGFMVKPAISSVAFSPNGQTLASAGRSKSIRLWDAVTGRELMALKGHAKQVNSVTFSPDSQMLASGSDDYTIKLWQVSSGKELHTFQLPPQSKGVKWVAISSTGKSLAALSGNGTIGLWDIVTGNELAEIQVFGAGSVAFSPNDEMLASGSENGTIKLWDVRSGSELRTFQGNASGINSIAFSPDGKTLVSGSEDNAIKLWSVLSGKELRTLQSAKKYAHVASVAFSPDGKRIATGGGPNATIKLWEVASSKLIYALEGDHSIYSVLFSPDRQTLVGTTSGTIQLWKLANGTDLRTLRVVMPSVAFSPDGQTLAHGRLHKTIRLLDMATVRELHTLEDKTWTSSVAFNPDGLTLASGNGEGTITLWDVSTAKPIRTLQGHTKPVWSLAFSPDGQTLASRSDDQTIKMWQVISGKELWTVEAAVGGHQNSRGISFSPDGRILASGFRNTIKLFEVATGRELNTLQGHAGIISSVDFSPDGQTLASSSDDQTIKLWDIGSGRELASLPGNSSIFSTVVFSLDGQTLASGSRDGKLRIWDVSTQTELCSLIAVGEDDWLVVTTDGLFDGSPAAWNRILWRFSPRLYDVAPVEAFFSDFYHPGLLAEIFAGKRPHAAKDIAQKDRRLPSVNLTLGDTQSSPITSRTVSVRVTVTEASADKDHSTNGGAQDLRLFRNGSLVKVWRGDLFGGNHQQGCKPAGEGKAICEANIRIVAGENRFTAYAFNHDNIKSEDAALSVSGAESLKGSKTAYVMAIGINEYANPQYNLRYAGADARAFADELQQQQIKLKQFDTVKVISLFDKEATKAGILKTLKNITSQTQPEDAVFIYFAGHGTAQGNRYYLIPHDLGYAGTRTQLDQRGLEMILSHSISDRELEQAFEKLDARTVTLVLDTCNSGQALESEEKRRGPMNSKGLAQLAYEKGMYILTAAESFQAAREAARLGHGYLTYALVEEGLKSAVADAGPTDGEVNLREWLDYATQRVPRMQREAMEQTRDLQHPLSFVEGEENIKDPAKRSLQTPRVFYRREPDSKPLIVAKP